ncbi:hypothetical protein PAECIP111893_00584 [Paenibacillus plantiphilus]|uniref:Uncharacterized protein n=1 Tax=Paenibacillus plantiphilus TaxID=2905650 RepID=A0ABN8G4J3_9BACL|nr:hypothetical protein PAECIP111893_00584 [Paenibacillus plantiphilus]
MILKKRQRSPLFPEFHIYQLLFKNPGNNSDRKNIPQHSGPFVPFNLSIYRWPYEKASRMNRPLSAQTGCFPIPCYYSTAITS